MSKKEFTPCWHKRKGKGAGVNALAVHSSLKGARPASAAAKLSGAEAFVVDLKAVIRKSI
jgi:hypothetical protein